MDVKLHTSGERDLVLAAGRAHPELAAAVARELGIELLPITAYDFANTETYVRFGDSIRGCDVFVLQTHAAPVNESIMEQLLMLDAAKRASARTLTAVIPFYGYARQDKKSRGREPISARLVADLLKTAGAHRIMSVDLHTAQIQGFFDGPVDHLWALPVLVEYVRTRIDTSNAVVVSPDAGRIRVAEEWGTKLGGLPLAFIHKTRDVTRPNSSKANSVVGNVEGKDCVLVDDLIDTAGTIVDAANVLMEAGAKSVIVAATHGVLSEMAIPRLQESPVKEVIITDTLPISPEQHFPKLTVLSIAPVLAAAISEVFNRGSVTSLFGGNT